LLWELVTPGPAVSTIPRGAKHNKYPPGNRFWQRAGDKLC